MPNMTIRVANSTFESTSTDEFQTLDDAYRSAIAAGLEIAAGEVAAGSLSSIVQLAVDVDGRRDAARGAVAVSTARVLTTGSATSA